MSVTLRHPLSLAAESAYIKQMTTTLPDVFGAQAIGLKWFAVVPSDRTGTFDRIALTPGQSLEAAISAPFAGNTRIGAPFPKRCLCGACRNGYFSNPLQSLANQFHKTLVFRMRSLQPAGYLLGRPIQSELPRHCLP